MTYNSNMFEAGRGSIYKSPPKSSSNANKQAAGSMKSAGIGGIGGKPTTSSAKKIQDQFRRETQRDDDRRGLGASPKVTPTPQKSFLESLYDRVRGSITFAGGDPNRKKRPDPNPGALYTASPFIIPAATAVTASVLGPAVDYTDPTQVPTGTPSIYTPASRDFGKGTEPMATPEKPETAKFDVTDLLGLKEKVARGDAPGLMASPSMSKPITPDMSDAINRTLASIKDSDPDVPYVIQAGDTLSEIAVQTGTTVEDLVRENKIEDKERIYTGDELKIPSTKSTKTKEDIVSSLIQGYERKKDMSGTQVASSDEILTDATDPDAQYYESFRQGITPEVKQELPFITSSDTTKGKRERIAYGEAYKNGLRGEELQSFMAQLAHESAQYGAMKEKGYSLSRAKQVGGKAWKERLERDNVFDPSNRNAKNTGPIQAATSENIFNSVYADRNGNGDFSSGDGNRYRGRGYIQLTGRGQYRAIGNTIGVDLENNPELMEDPVIAAKASVAYWKENVRGNVPDDDYSNTKAVSGIINRGSADKIASGLSDRKKLFNRYGQKITTTSTSLRPKARPLGRP